MIPRGKKELPFCERESFCKARHGARPIAAPAALGQRISSPWMTEAAQDLQVGKVVVENGLSLFHRFIQRVGFEAETCEQGLMRTTVIGEAADQG